MALTIPFLHRRCSSTKNLVPLLIASSSLLLFLSLRAAVDSLASQTPTLAGHNLDPTPWHPFTKQTNISTSSAILRCSYLSCRRITPFPPPPPPPLKQSQNPPSCPAYFGSIHSDLQPWKRSRITEAMLDEARKHAAMRILVVGGRLYVDLYYACVQSRAMFTIWGMLQLLRRYPGTVPDVDFMFDCMDRPTILRSVVYNGTTTTSADGAPPLFRYCTTKGHLDIPFPDWSFWGWSEIKIKPWEEEFRSIKLGSQTKTWEMKDPTAYWKGNPDVQSSIRVALLECNDAKKWGAKIIRQNWAEEVNSGFKNSALSSQCNHRYKIYAEGFAWSVSLKYILSCGSLTLVIDPLYEDFFSRGLTPRVNYWPVNATNLCQSIKSTVDWANKHPAKAKAIGKRGQDLMEELDMDHVYDYMYHLILEYSKLQDFKPVRPSSAQEVCPESILCLADENQRELLQRSYSSRASYAPCTLPQP